MAAGRVVAAMAAVAVALLAGGADADCFDYCYKNCIGNDRSMADYCNYACDKTCEPGLLRQRPLATVVGGLPIRCQIDCVRRSCTGLRKDRKGILACYRGCFDGCKTKTVPRPLRAGTGVDASSGPVSETKRGDAVRTTSEPDSYRYDAARSASVPIHAFHEKQDDVQPASVPDHPFHEKSDAVEPAAVPDHPFHEKQDAVQPAAVPDHPFHEKQDGVEPASVPEHPFHEKQDATETALVPDHPDNRRGARGP